MQQTTPPAKWVLVARTDLVAEYDALNQTEKAAAVRAQLAAAPADSIPAKD